MRYKRWLLIITILILIDIPRAVNYLTLKPTLDYMDFMDLFFQTIMLFVILEHIQDYVIEKHLKHYDVDTHWSHKVYYILFDE